MKFSFLILLSVTAILFAQNTISDEDVWNEFTGWLAHQAPNSRPGELIGSYRGYLLQRKLPEPEVARRMRVVSDFIFNRRKGVELLWDKVYAGRDPIFLERPSGVVVDAIQERKPGVALDIGMGQGRNSIYLATQGWDVTGFDPSSEGIRIARSNATQAGVKIRALVARDDEFDYGSNRWDLILMTYIRDLDQKDAERFWKALKPGGMVVYENGADEGNTVLKAFLRYQIVRFEDTQTTPDWNPQRKIRVQRLIARKTVPPAAP